MSNPSEHKLSGAWPRSRRVDVPPEAVARVHSLWEAGRFLDAHESMKPHGPLQGWSGASARQLGARLASALQADRLADWLHVTAYREDPGSDAARAAMAYYLRGKKGPLAAWTFLRDNPEGSAAGIEHRLDMLIFRSSIARRFRDFEAARNHLRQAKEVGFRSEKVAVEESYILQAEDDLIASLEEARRAEQINPRYHWARAQIAELLPLLHRDDEAEAYFGESASAAQCSYVASLHARYLSEKGRFEEMLAALDRFDHWAPLAEPASRHWSMARRTDALYHLGRKEEAAEWAARQGTDFYSRFSERLRSGEQGKAVRLVVSFVRQNHHTCAPATLTCLANYLGSAAEQDQVIDSICYDGSWDYQEREWAEKNDFFVREFRVTWESARQLLDLGIPFALATSQPGSGHLQAVIGYDTVRRSLIIREPGDRDTSEFDWEWTEKTYRSVGPRGMAFVPTARRGEIDGLDLPEGPLYDGCYRVQIALRDHRREGAAAVCREMVRDFPSERLTHIAVRALASYDGNVPEELERSRCLLSLFPLDDQHSLYVLNCLRRLGSRQERLEFLAPLVAKKEGHPLLRKEYATELAEDGRDRARALYFLRRVHGALPWQMPTVAKIADLLWDEGRISEAIQAYRFVACAQDKDEGASRSYFIATRWTKETEVSLDFLRERVRKYGGKAAGPVRTYFQSLERMDRLEEAFAALAEGIRRRPDDGDLQCFAADCHAWYGHEAEAGRLLAEAEEKSQRSQWLRTSARLVTNAGRLEEALELWRKIEALEPISEDVHTALVDLLSKTSGNEAALAHLRAAYEKFPHNADIGRQLLFRLEKEDGEEDIEHCRRLIASHPTDPWMNRRLASLLSKAGRFEGAIVQGRLAVELDLRSSYSYTTLGGIYERAGDIPEARKLYREALRRSVDNGFAIEHLIHTATSQEERRDDLLFIRDELARQVTFGDGLSEFRNQANRALPPEEVLEVMREAKAARPDLWHAWSTLASQLSDMGRMEEAETAAEATATRFPMTPGSWRDLGWARNNLQKWEEAAEAFEKAVELSPDWDSALCDLAEAWDRAGEGGRGILLLEGALKRNPHSQMMHGYLAEGLHHAGEKSRAIEHLKQAVRIDPDHDSAWNRLKELAVRDVCLGLARELCERLPGDADAWYRLSLHLDEGEEWSESLRAIDKAIALDLRNGSIYDRKAFLLAREGCYEEAIAACRPGVWGGYVPTNLRGREAWIEERRGNVDKAIEMMRQVVRDDANYNWGWGRLNEWLLRKNAPESVEAGDELVRLNPNSCYAYGSRADSKLHQGDRFGAIEDFRRAWSLKPSYTFAFWMLFDLVLDDEQFEEAERLLDSAEAYSDPVRVFIARVRISLAKEDISGALERLKSAGQLRDAERNGFDRLEEDFDEAEALSDLDRCLDGMAGLDSIPQALFALWIKRRLVSQADRIGKEVVRRIHQGTTAWSLIAEAYFEALGGKGLFGAHAQELVQSRSFRNQCRGQLWGYVSYALASSGQWSKCRDWTADWRGRSDVESWMLANRSVSLRNLSLEKEAAEVDRKIVELRPSNAPHRLFLAVDAALAGRGSEAKDLLSQVDAKKLSDHDKFLQTVVEELSGIEAANENRWRIARKKIGDAFANLKKPQWRTRCTYHKALARLDQLGIWRSWSPHRLWAGDWRRRYFEKFVV